ncbi:MAG: adenylate cyclase [Helicobacteraceae bacterium 4484_230]|nr:MAG: adenylate cyclase [Helicobacteraceae bacterium 4484_230]
MGKEIERKFLVNLSLLNNLPEGSEIKQGYIPAQDVTVRIRIMDNKAYLTLKGKSKGITRSEFEYSIPINDAKAMLEELCTPPIIEKTRHKINFEDHIWELDIFKGDNGGLVMAEVELKSENETLRVPPWVTKEVSGDRRYFNANLRINPYMNWDKAPQPH